MAERLNRTAWIGAVSATVALIVAAGAWAFQRTSSASLAPAPEQAAVPVVRVGGDLPGFRADAWYLPDDSLLGFVEIPAGPFLMGSDPAVDRLAFDNERWGDTGGQKVVEAAAFYVGRYEVTVAQLRAFVQAEAYAIAAQALEGPLDHPATNVSWPDALAYARWLDASLRESPDTPAELARLLQDGWKVTLPTEAEWEKAARGTDGRIYPWGNEPSRGRANFMGPGTAPVGTFDCPECPYGLSDMSGNVWELTRTPYQALPYDPSGAASDLREDALWVMRGGSFGDGERNVRAAIRGGADPGARRPFIGFRLVITRD